MNEEAEFKIAVYNIEQQLVDNGTYDNSEDFINDLINDFEKYEYVVVECPIYNGGLYLKEFNKLKEEYLK